MIGSWEGRKNFRVGIFLNKNLLGLGYRKQTTFFLDLIPILDQFCSPLVTSTMFQDEENPFCSHCDELINTTDKMFYFNGDTWHPKCLV